MKTSSNNNNIESNNRVNNTLPAWCKNGQHVLFEGKLHVIECVPKKEYEHLHEVLIEDCVTRHCHFEDWDNLTPYTPVEVHIDVEPTSASEIKDDWFFTKGKKYRCIKSVKGSFTKGKVYEQSSDPTQWHGYFRNDEGISHIWPQPAQIAHSCELYDMKPEDLDPRLYFEPVEDGKAA